MLITLSWRNIWRNKVRSLVVIFAIAIGLTGGIFFVGIMNGMVAQQVSNAINNEISDIQIHLPEFEDNMSLRNLIVDVDKKADLILQQKDVTSVSYRTKTTAMASTATTGAGVILHGIVPESERKVTTIGNSLVEGAYFEKKSKTPSIIIGQKLSHKLKADIGNKIVITLQTMDGEMSYLLFRVEGIYKTTDTRFDEAMVFVNSADLNPLLGIQPAQANEIAIRTTSNQAAFQVADMLKAEYPELSVKSWKEIEPMLLIMLTVMDQYGYWIISIILLALIFGIINTMLMVILERQREIGMLMAIGMNKVRIFRMILTETTLLSLTGGFLGLISSIIMMGIMGNTGLNFSYWAEGMEAIGYSAFVYPVVTTGFYAGITILVILTAIIASIWPTRKALKLKPAEAVRIE